MLSNITTSPGICQEPETLNDLKANGKPRPWKRHKRSAQLLSAVYEILADEYPEQAARFLDRSRRIADSTTDRV